MQINTSDWIQLGILAANVMLVAAACSGLRSWRHELVNRRRFEIGERTLVLLSKVRSAFHYVRIPLIRSTEGETLLTEREKNSPIRNTLAEFLAAAERLDAKEINAVFEQIVDVKYTAGVILGPDVEKGFEQLQLIQRDLLIQVGSVRSLLNDCLQGEAARIANEWRPKIYNYEFDGGKDSITQHLDDASKLIEDVCRPLLKSLLSPPPRWKK